MAIHIIFLAVDAEALRLPAFDSASVWYLVYFLLVIVAGLLYLQWRLRKIAQREALSNRFMQILMRRALTRSQLAAMNDFFKKLHETEQNEIMLSAKSLEHHLHFYLDKHPEIPANDRVEIFDKLLPNQVARIEIKSVTDLKIGEICALDIGKNSYLATAMKTKDNQVLITAHDKKSLPVGKAALYAYRPGLGGFLMAGEITKVNGQSLIFRHDGVIEFKGDQHLMCIVSLPIKIERWPHPDMEVDKDNPAHSEQNIDIFNGFSDKISDRALTVRLNPMPPDWMLKRQDFWEMTLELPEAPLVCRVKVATYTQKDLCLMRPVDLESADRNRLYKFISESNPVREHF